MSEGGADLWQAPPTTAKYRAYEAAVEKALKGFESSQEWADLISALGKLAKVIQSNAKLGDIPKALAVAKRLAQCLHPNLPAGVHIKAIQVYRQIFALLEPASLVGVLHVFAVGLFPLVGLAQIKVKRELLTLLETEVVPLGRALRPALPGLLAAVLPAYEEGSEFFQRCATLLEDLAAAVGQTEFFTGLWWSVRESPGLRLPALLFASSTLQRQKALDDQLELMGASPDLMVGALAAAAADEQVLVKRLVLSFLTSVFPLHSPHLLRQDAVRLLSAALYVPLVRDMSLNKRLYSWLLGPGQGGDEPLEYLRRWALPVVEESVKETVAGGGRVGEGACGRKAEDEELEPRRRAPEGVLMLSRVLLYFLDRPDLGEELLSVTLSPLLTAYQHQMSAFAKAESSTKENPDAALLGEMSKAFALLVNALDSGRVWTHMTKEAGLADGEAKLGLGCLAALTKSLLTHLQLDSDASVRSLHLPRLLAAFVAALTSRLSSGQVTEAMPEVLDACRALLQEIQLSSQLRLSEEQNVVEDDTWRKELLQLSGQVFQSFRRSPGHAPTRSLVFGVCGVLRELLKFPSYSAKRSAPSGRSDAGWLDDMWEAALLPWRRTKTRDPTDWSRWPGTWEVLETTLEIVVSCRSVAEERNGVSKDARTEEDSATRQVFLEPLAWESSEGAKGWDGWLSEASEEVWASLSESGDGGRLARLLHTAQRDPYTSALEELVVRELTSGSGPVRLEAMRRFWSMWRRAREEPEEELQLGLQPKPFHTALSLILSGAGKTGADAWAQMARDFVLEGVRHGETFQLLQPLLLQLHDPATQRVSVQYLTAELEPLERAATGLELSRMETPSGFRLYHLWGQGPCDSQDVSSQQALRAAAGELLRDEEGCLGWKSAEGELLEEVEEEAEVETVVSSIVSYLVEEVAVELDAEARLGEQGVVDVSGSQDDEGSALELELGHDAALAAPESPRASASPFLHSHVHFLLYTHSAVETGLRRSHFALEAFRGLLDCEALGGQLSASLASANTPSSAKSLLKHRLALHNRHSLGKAVLASPEHSALAEPNSTLLEVLINACLHHLRSYLINSPLNPVAESLLRLNWATKTRALEVLSTLLRLLSESLHSSSLSNYVRDLIRRSKLEKCLLHSLIVSVQELPKDAEKRVEKRGSLSEDIVRLNVEGLGEESWGYQRWELEAVLSLLKLEAGLGSGSGSGGPREEQLADSRLFLLTSLQALKLERASVHVLWVNFLCSALPLLASSAPPLCLHLSEQLSRNLHSALGPAKSLPAGYVPDLLSWMAQLWHLCLLNSAPASNLANPIITGSGSAKRKALIPTPVDGLRTIGSMFRVFGTAESPAEASPGGAETKSWLEMARDQVLAALPHILSTIGQLWWRVESGELPPSQKASGPLLNRLMLDLLSPVALYYPSQFLSALAMVWVARAKPHSDGALRQPDPEQAALAKMVLRMRIVPLDRVVWGILWGLKNPVQDKKGGRSPASDGLLEVLREILRESSGTGGSGDELSKGGPLYQLLAFTAASQQPSVVFRGFQILLLLAPSSQAEGPKGAAGGAAPQLQELGRSFLEALNGIVGSQLEGKATWGLKRTTVLRPAVSSGALDELGDSVSSHSFSLSESKESRDAASASASASGTALRLLAGHTHSFVDAVWQSAEERDKVLPAITALFANMQPFLKSRSRANAENLVSVALWLENLSEFHWSRSIWKRAALDLFLDGAFFKLPLQALEHWTSVLENLFAQDKPAVKELLGRLSYTGGVLRWGESEAEVKRAGLRRVGFAVLACSATTFQAHMGELREKLTELAKALSGAEAVEAELLGLFRVLLLRLSAQQLSQLWPLLFTQLLSALLRLQRCLSDPSSALASLQPGPLALFLAAAKLLDQLHVMPPSALPTYQMYEWGLVPVLPGPVEELPNGANGANAAPSLFVSHAQRIAKLLRSQEPRSARARRSPGPASLSPHNGRLSSRGDGRAEKAEPADLSGLRSVASVWELRAFFERLAQPSDYASPHRPLSQAQALLRRSILQDLLQDLDS